MTSHDRSGRSNVTTDEKVRIKKEWLEKWDSTEPDNSPVSTKMLSEKYGISQRVVRTVLKELPEFQTYLREYRKSWDLVKV